jgi:hypothetical protein
MRGLVCSCLFFTFSCSIARAELQLVPEFYEYDLDGARVRAVAFADGMRRVVYTPPRGWTYSGSAAEFTMRPPGIQRGEASISRHPAQSGQNFDEENIKHLTKETMASMPNDARNITLLSVDRDPVTIGGKETLLLVFEYDLRGEKISRSILYLNRGPEQLRFQLVCPKTNFPALQQAFIGSQFSWQNL